MPRWLTAVICVLVAGCQAFGTGRPAGDLASLVADCTQRHGFDPAAEGLPERALAPGEAAWNECLYQAVATELADDYRQLIGRHRHLAEALSVGAISRLEMQDELRLRLEAVEEAQRRRSTESVDRMVKAAMEEQRQIEYERQLGRINRQALERALLGR